MTRRDRAAQRAEARAKRAAVDPVYAERSAKAMAARAEVKKLTPEERQIRRLEQNRLAMSRKIRREAAERAAVDPEFARRSASALASRALTKNMTDEEIREYWNARRRAAYALKKQTKQAELLRACQHQSEQTQSAEQHCTAAP